jgi:hypothetical protein
MQYLKIMIVISMLMALTVFFSKCINGNSFVSNDPRGDQYANAGSCGSCHRDVSGSYAHSNHYRTSSPVDDLRLKELIASSKDPIYFGDSSYVSIEESNGALFQSDFSNGRKTVSGKFDIAIGSGEKAQTYGYWKENKLYQLPLTWFMSIKTWANSPGFTFTHARFGRIIESRCFECHASYIARAYEQASPVTVNETLDKNTLVYGIDCQRCHGPALAHVKFQEEHPDIKTSRYILSIRSLTRQQQLDLCAVCHSGNDQTPERSLFAFAPGDTLSHFYFPVFGADNGEPDVHGKQMQLLRSSKCFSSTTMTCTTCHAAHASEENRMAAFISKCMDCHQRSAHAAAVLKDNEQKKRDFNLVGTNCIDCHMPLQASKAILFNNGGQLKNIPYFIRTHKIGIYK